MNYKGRAFYNLLQMNLKQGVDLKVDRWQIEDYRILSKSQLFQRLESFDIFLDQENFLLYIEESDAPEDLTDTLCLKKTFEEQQGVFLLIFELWRRLGVHKQSLSIFCDQFDFLVEEYEEGKTECEEKLELALLSIQRILEDHVDEGGDPIEGFCLLSEYSCHNIPLFIYEYILSKIHLGNECYASELLEGVYEYIEDKRWFDLLRIRLVSAVDYEEGGVMLMRLLESLNENKDKLLLFEALHFLLSLGENNLFIQTFEQLISQLKTEEDLQKLAAIAGNYLNGLEKIQEEKILATYMKEREDRLQSDSITLSDPIIRVLEQLIIKGRSSIIQN